MKPKRIMLIIPELMVGGAQRSLSKLSVALAQNHRVWVVLFNTLDGIAYPYGGELVSLDVKPTGGVFQKLISFFQRVVRLRKLKKKLGIDVSISFLEGADYVNILSRRSEKVVVSIRGSKIHDETIMGRFFWLRHNILIPTLYKKADVIVTVNHGIAQELKSAYGLHNSTIKAIGNFYRIEEIEKLAHEPKSENERRLYQNPVFITTGRLAPEKGLIPLVKVFAGLKQRVAGLRLVMVGDGPEHHRIEEVCRAEKLVVYQGFDFDETPDVVLAGAQSNVFKYLAGASVYLMNSSSEGFPNGLAEAMICHVPVASADCPYGPREILAPEFPYTVSVKVPFVAPNGLLLPMIKSDADSKVWVDSLFALIADPQQRQYFSTQGYGRMQEFSTESILDQWNSILQGDEKTSLSHG